jgi:hypothetical protein
VSEGEKYIITTFIIRDTSGQGGFETPRAASIRACHVSISSAQNLVALSPTSRHHGDVANPPVICSQNVRSSSLPATKTRPISIGRLPCTTATVSYHVFRSNELCRAFPCDNLVMKAASLEANSPEFPIFLCWRYIFVFLNNFIAHFFPFPSPSSHRRPHTLVCISRVGLT